MGMIKAEGVSFTIQTDIAQHGEECNVRVDCGGQGGGGFNTTLAKGEAIMRAVGYADAVEYDQQDNAFHIIFKL